MKTILFLSFLFFMFNINAHTVFIIIHGTWAMNMAWYMPGGDFFDELEKSTRYIDGVAVPFLWSGKLDHGKRLYAAQGLVKLIQSYPLETKICIAAHSHGANVGILATQLLGQDPNNIHHIHAFYALGAPVCREQYVPNMHIVRYFYNLFSAGDMVQPVFGWYNREYIQHTRIANLKVMVENYDPGHSGLHHKLIGEWIPFLHERLAMSRLGNFEKFDFEKPGIIYFAENCAPKYLVDTRFLCLEQTTC